VMCRYTNGISTWICIGGEGVHESCKCSVRKADNSIKNNFHNKHTPY